jgi:hypothetical protein
MLPGNTNNHLNVDRPYQVRAPAEPALGRLRLHPLTRQHRSSSNSTRLRGAAALCANLSRTRLSRICSIGSTRTSLVGANVGILPALRWAALRRKTSGSSSRASATVTLCTSVRRADAASDAFFNLRVPTFVSNDRMGSPPASNVVVNASSSEKTLVSLVAVDDPGSGRSVMVSSSIYVCRTSAIPVLRCLQPLQHVARFVRQLEPA